jgi:hypothetical protein
MQDLTLPFNSCGLTKYVAYITLPPPIISADRNIATATATTRIRKCNCTTCQKTSNVSLRLMDSPNDFYLLSPITSDGGALGGIDVNPEGGLKDYMCIDYLIHWYFCSKCGVRCFNMMGEGEIRDVEVEGKVVKAWTPKREGWVEGPSNLSVNATSIDAGQEGFDMREVWIIFHYLGSWRRAVWEPLSRPYKYLEVH